MQHNKKHWKFNTMWTASKLEKKRKRRTCNNFCPIFWQIFRQMGTLVVIHWILYPLYSLQGIIVIYQNTWIEILTHTSSEIVEGCCVKPLSYHELLLQFPDGGTIGNCHHVNVIFSKPICLYDTSGEHQSS